MTYIGPTPDMGKEKGGPEAAFLVLLEALAYRPNLMSKPRRASHKLRLT
jgi:hypothetical protein